MHKQQASILLIDDTRTIEGATICRTAISAYKAIERGEYDYYYFDHDLGRVKPGTSGYDVLTWALENELIPKKSAIWLTTSNPVGRARMEAAMRKHNMHSCNGMWRFWK